jgi:hypothetical protein
MALQDLTPQLRTRLTRMERAVGWFLFVATALLVFGFGYYLYQTAKNRGWFTQKFNYHTSMSTAAGFKVGDKVLLSGFAAGEISRIERDAPGEYYPVTVSFWVDKTNVGYIWSDSKVKINADFLGNRSLEITRGIRGLPTILQDTNKEVIGRLRRKFLLQRIKDLSGQYTNQDDLYKALKQDSTEHPTEYYTNMATESIHGYWLDPDESPTINDQAQKLVLEVQNALPNILALTNKIGAVLSNTADLTSNLNAIAASARPAVSNLDVITANLRGPKGSLGEWLIPSNINAELGSTLANANVTITNVDTNLIVIAESISKSLDNLANITSNLNNQVQANSNMLAQISDIIVHTDQFVQGLKHHWLLRSAFKTPATNAPPSDASGVFQSPREKGR